MLRPFRAWETTGKRTQGGGNSRTARVALPWAMLFRPFQGGQMRVSRTSSQKDVFFAFFLDVIGCGEIVTDSLRCVLRAIEG